MDWQPSELALSGITEMGAEHIADYERNLGFDPATELKLLTNLGLEGSDLIEFGPGPGGFARAAAGVARSVTAVDPSPVMTAHIKEQAEIEGITNLAVVTGGFLSYNHEGEPVDFVFTKNALHHLPDYWKGQALARVAAMMRPGGIFRLRDLVFSFDPGDATKYLSAWIDEASGNGGWSEETLIKHIRDEFSTYHWAMERLLEEAGFEISDRWYSDNKIFAHYTATRAA